MLEKHHALIYMTKRDVGRPAEGRGGRAGGSNEGGKRGAGEAVFGPCRARNTVQCLTGNMGPGSRAGGVRRNRRAGLGTPGTPGIMVHGFGCVESALRQRCAVESASSAIGSCGRGEWDLPRWSSGGCFLDYVTTVADMNPWCLRRFRSSILWPYERPRLDPEIVPNGPA